MCVFVTFSFFKPHFCRDAKVIILTILIDLTHKRSSQNKGQSVLSMYASNDKRISVHALKNHRKS